MEPITPRVEQTCYRHPDRNAGVRCQRCERPICPSCMTTASVGFHCPECARGGRQEVYTRATVHRARALRPLVTQVLVALNVLVFGVGIVVDLVRGLPPEGRSNPLFDGSQYFIPGGALFGPAVDTGDWYRILTSGFLHAGVVHLAFNMLALWRIGQVLEPALGRGRFLAAYVASLLTGSLGALLVSPNSFTVGASGAIFGLFGLLFLAARARGIDPWASGIGMIIGVNLLITFSFARHISVGGHVGGLAGGLLVGWVLFTVAPAQRMNDAQQVVATVVLALAAAAGCLVVA